MTIGKFFSTRYYSIKAEIVRPFYLERSNKDEEEEEQQQEEEQEEERGDPRKKEVALVSFRWLFPIGSFNMHANNFVLKVFRCGKHI